MIVCIKVSNVIIVLLTCVLATIVIFALSVSTPQVLSQAVSTEL